MSPTEQAVAVLQYDQEIAPIVAAANELVIKNDDQSLGAQEVLKEIKRRQKKVEETFDPIVSSAHASWKKTCDTRASFLNPLKEAEGTIKKKVIAFESEAEKKREEQARKDEAARQEKERKEREKIQAQAEAARAAGKTEKAEALEEKASSVSVALNFKPAPMASKASGTSFKKTWKGEVKDLKALCLAIGEGRAPVDLVVIDQSALNKYADVIKKSMIVPGVTFEEVTGMAVRS